MKVKLNGEEREIPEQLTLADLIQHLSLAPERLAIELNREVVRRADWASIKLSENDRIEIVHFVGGGARKKNACL